MTQHKQKSEREEQILRAAVACFARAGFHNTKMDDIADEAHLSKGSLYRYYANKKQLFLAILDWYSSPFEEDIAAALKAIPTATAQLETLVSMMGQAADDPELKDLSVIAIDFYAAMRFDEEVSVALNAYMTLYLTFFEQIIALGVANGEFKPVDPRKIGVGIAAILDGMGLYAMMGIEDFDVMSFAQAMLQVLLMGLKAEK